VSASDGVFPTAAFPTPAIEKETTVLSIARSEDELLMMRVQNGDEGALGQLFDRHAQTVLGIGMRVLRDPGEAQELVQDVFLQVYQKCHLFDPERGTARAWLLQTAYHRAFDRREYLQFRRFYENQNLEDYSEVMRASSDVEYEAQLEECEAVLRKAFEGLNENQRVTLQLFFFEGYTLREISDRLKEPLPKVRHFYYRGLKKLKESVDINSLNEGE
jgi:RNA polymerase sigma-70 factor, ECF subfamily